MKLHQTFLMTSDLERSKAFYEALGFDILEEGSRSVAFETGAAQLKIEADFGEAELAAFGLEPPGERRGDGVIIVVDVDDVDAVSENAEAATAAYGGDVLTTPRDVDWGRRLMLVEDPDGYVLEISQPQ
ncbi:VOC family protein [Haloferax sp. DFSO52]|uniref:VOC family protein n=1 Tax=Haloferax sp. DFSO52 TaxID=3388505 RepID=UPI003A8C3C4C